MSEPFSIVFGGTPEFAVPALDALLASPHRVVAVYTQPDRPAGRGRRARPSPVKQRAVEQGLRVRQPASLKPADEQRRLAQLRPDLMVVVAYGLILPEAVLETPALGCVNIHASLLPRWRGAAPIQRAVMAGDAETGVSIMRMEAGLDTGPVLLREAVAIGAEETAGDLHDRLAVLGARLIVEVLEGLDGLVAEPQPEVGVTYAAKIDKAEARVDWARSAVDVDRQIRGLSPFPGAWIPVSGERVKLLRSRVIGGEGVPGEHLGGFRVACGSGAVEVLEAQREGKRPMAAAEVLRGMALPARLE